jgi:hypothetical protein
MTNGQLLLYPSTSIKQSDKVINSLKAVKLIDKPWKQETDWLAGDNFLKLIAFMGCSPYIEFEPPASGEENFCFVRLLGPFDERQFIYGKNVRPPQCPHCFGKTDKSKNFPQQTKNNPEQNWTCPSCDKDNHLADLNWRKQAGAASLFIVINSIFPSEAIPGNELLNALKNSTDCEWKYFYLQE